MLGPPIDAKLSVDTRPQRVGDDSTLRFGWGRDDEMDGGLGV